MTPLEIIRKADPQATDEFCEFILWSRTPFPMGAVTAKSLYKATMRWKRATAHKIKLCEFCDNPSMPNNSLCCDCKAAMDRVG